MLVKTLAITTLAALAAAAPSPAEEENSLEARNNWGWIPALYARAQTWPNCGIAGVNCGKSGKYWFCAPHRASCCKSELQICRSQLTFSLHHPEREGRRGR